MANTTVNIDVKVESKSLGVLENELNSINQELKQVEIGSEAFKSLSTKAQALTKDINAANTAIEGFTDDKKFMAADGAIKAMGGSLAGVVGVLGLIGVESDVFGEFEKKAASAIAVAMGIKDVSEGYKQLKDSTLLATAASKLFGSTTKAAIAATGIGALVIALVVLAQNFDAVKAAVYRLVPGLESVGKYIGNIVEAVTDFVGATSEEERALGRLKAAADQTLSTNKKFMAEHGDQLDQYTKRKVDAKNAYAEAIKAGTGDEIELAKRLNRELAQADKDRQADRDKANKEAADKRKADAEKAAADRKSAQDKIDSEAKKKADDLIALKKEVATAEANTEAEKYAKELTDLDTYYAELIAKAQKNNIDTAELERSKLQAIQAVKDDHDKVLAEKAAENKAIIDEALQTAELNSMDDVFAKAQAELEIQRQTDIQKLTQAGATADQLKAINASYAKQSEDIAKEEAEFKQNLRDADVQSALQASSQVLGSIIGIVGEGSAIGKAAAVAQTTIDTYASATAAYKSVVGIPIVGPTLAPIAAGVAVAAGLMSIKKIVATKVPGGGGGGAGASVTNPASAAPNMLVSQNVTPKAPQFENTTPAVRTYVLAGDVTSSQEADAKISRKRTIG